MKWPHFFRFYMALVLIFAIAMGAGVFFLKLKAEQKEHEFADQVKSVIYDIPARVRALPSEVLKIWKRCAAVAQRALDFLKNASINPEASLEASGLKGQY